MYRRGPWPSHPGEGRTETLEEHLREQTNFDSWQCRNIKSVRGFIKMGC